MYRSSRLPIKMVHMPANGTIISSICHACFQFLNCDVMQAATPPEPPEPSGVTYFIVSSHQCLPPPWAGTTVALDPGHHVSVAAGPDLRAEPSLHLRTVITLPSSEGGTRDRRRKPRPRHAGMRPIYRLPFARTRNTLIGTSTRNTPYREW